MTPPIPGAPDRGVRFRAPAGLTLLGLLAFCVAWYHEPVPSGNEYLYLLQAWRDAHPAFLATDWSFQQRVGGHFIFTTLAALPMHLLPLAVAGWLGRLVGWTVLLAGMVRLGQRLGLPAPLAGLGIVLWIAGGQSLVGGEWLIGGIEAKVLAWTALLWGMVLLLEERPRLGGALVGLAFSLHAAVGLWGVPAVAVGLLVAGTPRRALVEAGIACVITALPGAIAATVLAAGTSGDRALWEIVARVRMPFHLDPLTFGVRKLAILALITALNLTYAWRHPARAVRFLGGVQLVGAAVFAAGMGLRLAGGYEWLRFFPFRFLPPVAGLAFLWQAIRLLLAGADERPRPWLAVAMLVGCLALPSFVDTLRQGLLPREETEPELVASFRWLREHTPPDAVILSPPWRRDVYWVSQRAQVVQGPAIPYSALEEWRTRYAALVGPLTATTRNGIERATLRARYAALPEDSVRALGRRYGAGFLVSEGGYGLTELYRAGSWRVYALPAPP